MSQRLTFQGRITSGVGRYSDMVIPDRKALPDAPPDWPEQLRAGSLNVVVDQWPNGFTPPSGFQPALTIHYG